jgi:hypothetical protein
LEWVFFCHSTVLPACRPFISRLLTEAIVMVLLCPAGFGFGLLVFS